MSGVVESDTTIQSWLNRMVAGEVDARDLLIEHATGRLRVVTRTMLRRSPLVRRWEETDDVVQRAVLRLYQCLAEVRPSTVRELFGLARLQIRRELVDLARHYYGPQGHGRHHDANGSPDWPNRVSRHEAIDDTHEPSSLAEWTEFHEQVGLLPDAERETFELRWYQGLTFEEIGTIIGATDRTAKRHWRSACRILHERLRTPPDASEEAS